MADFLWAQGEKGTAIRILKKLNSQKFSDKELHAPEKATILAKLVSSCYMLENAS